MVDRKYQAPTVQASRVVQKPVSAAQREDPREFQLGQVRRRFSPTEKNEANGTSLTFKLVPSDPDFPYEIDALECCLSVPKDYPQSGAKPKLRILNKDIPRGFQINLEQGFDEIVSAASDATLLGLFNRLDRSLAELLSRPMAETVKIYKHSRDTRSDPQPSKVVPTATPAPAPVKAVVPSYTESQKADAAQKRQSDVRQLVARLGKAPGFYQSADGVTFTLPSTVYHNPNAPAAVRDATSLQLIVPEMYNLTPCRISFSGQRSLEVENIEAAFSRRVESQMTLALLAHINYLSQNLKAMAEEKKAVSVETQKTSPIAALKQPIPPTTLPARPIDAVPTDKPHVQIIPRPIEWGQPRSSDAEDSSSDESYSDESDDDEEDPDPQNAPQDTVRLPTTGVAEKGILLSFPNLELHGIELLELTSLSLTVKCDRCKELKDFERLKNNETGDQGGMKEEGCKKCAASLAAGFRMDLIHANSSRAGYVDLDGCTAVDMLPR